MSAHHVTRPALESIPIEIDSRAQWNTWAAIRASTDHTGVVGSSLTEVDRQPALDQESFMWRVAGLVMLIGIVLVLVL